jgi:ATP-dependent Lhr-like helicase
MLSLTGEIGWARLSRMTESSATTNGSLRVAVFLRDHAEAWHALRFGDATEVESLERAIPAHARELLNRLRTRGASFLQELARTGLGDEPAIRSAIASLAATGLVTSDGFAGVRSVLHTLRRHTSSDQRHDGAGRWFPVPIDFTAQGREEAVETQARSLLTRYGVVFRRLCQRETNPAPWRELATVYRRLEARGEIRGGRFVSGMSGEQFALPEAVERLREVRKSKRDGSLTTISAVDPLNLTGILTSGERVRSITSTRMVYRDGMALAVLEGDYIRPLAEIDPTVADGLATALAGRHRPAVTSGFVGR